MFYLQRLYVIKINKADPDEYLLLWIFLFPIGAAGVTADI